MFPDLFESTKDYWQKLDKIESAYHNDELTLEEVDAKVKQLMQELGQKRRESLTYFWQSLRHRMSQSQDILIGLGFLVVVVYGWILLEFNL